MFIIGNKEIAELLIKKGGANINAQNVYRQTPLR